MRFAAASIGLSLALVASAGCGGPACPSGYVVAADLGYCVSLDAGPSSDASSDGPSAADASGVEVCDPAGRDEDGDPSTLGPDSDGDGSPATTCCNRQPTGALLCGTDCDDTMPSVHAGAEETCNGVDDDCDGIVDGAAALAWCLQPAGLVGASGAVCGSTSCELTCDPGRLDCTSAPGCESSADDATSCGSCSNRCVHPTCATRTCALDFAAITAGRDVTCAVRGNGAVSCWGENASCAIDYTVAGTDRSAPFAIAGLDSVTSVATNGSTTCALRAGAVTCWGDNSEGEVGDGRLNHSTLLCPGNDVDVTASHVAVATLPTVVELRLGPYLSCARAAAGTVSCWGDDYSGQLGDGLTAHSACTMSDCSPSPVSVWHLNDAVRLATGNGFACAARSTGQITCWGANGSGALGDGLTMHSVCDTFDCARTPVVVSTLVDAVDVAAGDGHACARTATGHVACWGLNDHGQLGDGTTSNRNTPAVVAGLSDAVALALGGSFSCVLRASGGVSCWGDNLRGELGDGTTMQRLLPTTVAGVTDAVALAVGRSHACVLRSTHEVLCWGANDGGQLGDGTTLERHAPTPVVDP